MLVNKENCTIRTPQHCVIDSYLHLFVQLEIMHKGSYYLVTNGGVINKEVSGLCGKKFYLHQAQVYWEDMVDPVNLMEDRLQ